jgi:hypothetical protein
VRSKATLRLRTACLHPLRDPVGRDPAAGKTIR